MTRKKTRPIPEDEDLIRIFTGQAFKDFIAENWPGNKEDKTRAKPDDVEQFARGTLGDARVYIRDAVKPESKTTGRPMMSPIMEAAINFARDLQLTYYAATGEQPSFTATRARRGPFARILRECLLRLGAPVDDITFINTLQDRSNTMNDEKRRKRRVRKQTNFKTDPE